MVVVVRRIATGCCSHRVITLRKAARQPGPATVLVGVPLGHVATKGCGGRAGENKNKSKAKWPEGVPGENLAVRVTRLGLSLQYRRESPTFTTSKCHAVESLNATYTGIV